MLEPLTTQYISIKGEFKITLPHRRVLLTMQCLFLDSHLFSPGSRGGQSGEEQPFGRSRTAPRCSLGFWLNTTDSRKRRKERVGSNGDKSVTFVLHEKMCGMAGLSTERTVTDRYCQITKSLHFIST